MGRYRLLKAFYIVVLLFYSMTSFAVEKEIRLGMSTALTGPAEQLGKNVLLGVHAGIARVNRVGGIDGIPLRIIAVDDGYEPALTAPNMRYLINDKKVLAVIGNVGTPTAVAAIPIANETTTLLFSAYTGAGVLRKSSPDRYVINYRASYAEETAEMVDALIKEGGVAPEEIAFFTQRDSYGDAGFVGGINALKRHGLQNMHEIVHGRYERNTLSVESGLADILLHDVKPKAIIIVGAYAPSAYFIQLAKKNGLNALFLNVSFVGSAPLATALGDSINNVIVTQVVPYPKDINVPLVVEYQSDLSSFDENATFSFGSLEGYVAIRILSQAMLSIQDEPNRENIIDALEDMGEFDIGTGSRLFLSDREHQASHQVWPTRLIEGEFVPFDWSEIKGMLD